MSPSAGKRQESVSRGAKPSVAATPPSAEQADHGTSPAAIAAIALLFLATRLALLLTRAPFYDELFTRWIVMRPAGSLLAALRLDSGPPLYYQLVRLVSSGGNAIVAGRTVSLVASAVTLLVLLSMRRMRRRPLIAAALFSAFPAAVFAAADARGYALCAMFIALGLAALDRWLDGAGGARFPSAGRLLFAVACLVLAAYSHDYGVLFFPAPCIFSLFSRRRRTLLEGLGASAACGLLYLPGFALAAIQPRGAIQWMPNLSPAAPIAGLAFAARYPNSLLAPAPVFLILLAAALLALAVVRTGSSERALRFAAITILPIAVVAIYGALRQPVYFPLRFDSIVAVPLVLWLDAALCSWSRPARRTLTGGMVLIGLAVITAGAIDHARRSPDPYRASARWARRSLDPRWTLISSGYAWLEVWSATGGAWQPRIAAFPREQGEHPGWRATASREELAAQRDRLLRSRGPLIWIGERGPELESMLEVARLDVLHAEGPVVVAQVKPGER